MAGMSFVPIIPVSSFSSLLSAHTPSETVYGTWAVCEYRHPRLWERGFRQIPP